MVSSCARGDLDLIFGKISSPEGLSRAIVGTGCTGKWLSHNPWRYSKDM